MGVVGEGRRTYELGGWVLVFSRNYSWEGKKH